MDGTVSKKELVGALVKPSDIASPATKQTFSDISYGLVTRADWDRENRILYVELLVGNKQFLEREYKSVSQFLKFWTVQKTKKTEPAKSKV